MATLKQVAALLQQLRVLAPSSPPRNPSNDEVRAWADAVEAQLAAGQRPEREIAQLEQFIVWARDLPRFESRAALLLQIGRGEFAHYSAEQWAEVLAALGAFERA